MTRMIGFYNHESERFAKVFAGLDKKTREAEVDGFIDTDTAQISWNRSLKQELVKDRRFALETNSFTHSVYRPFTKQWLYFNRQLNDMVYQMLRIFPDAEAKNQIIYLSGSGNGGKEFSALILDAVPDLNLQHSGGQGFPLYLYDESKESTEQSDLFTATGKPGRKRRDAITDEGLAHFQSAYPGEQISKEDVFYYVYGLLHSPDYRERYADNLSKELPRIPRVKTATDFWAFSQAGRKLAELHLNYETVEPYLLLDALVCNQDRHHENWGLIGTPEHGLTLAPTFDHASSLGRNETDETRKSRLNTKDKGYSVESYVAKALSGFFENKSSTKAMSTVDAFVECAKANVTAGQYWLDRLYTLKDSDFSDILSDIPDEFISPEARDFANAMLRINRNRLLSLNGTWHT